MTDEPRGARTDLADLIGALRDAEFRVGTSEAIDATTLLLALAERQLPLDDPRVVRSRLRSIFCKSADQQRAFAAIFDEWWSRRSMVPVEPKKDVAPSGESEATRSESDEVPVKPIRHRPETSSRVAWKAVALVTSLVVVGGVLWRRTPPASVTPPVVNPQPITNITDPPRPLEKTEKPAIDRFLPKDRFNVEVRPWWVWMLALAPLAALLGVAMPGLVLSRSRPRRRADPMFLNTSTLEDEARRIVPKMRPEVGDRLARHIRSKGIDIERQARRPTLDVRRTLEATVRNHGIPTLRFSVVHAYPSYLILVDVTSETDPRGRLFYQWAERLQREGLNIEMMTLRRMGTQEDAVRVCAASDVGRPQEQWIPIRRLRQPPFGERLVVVSDGDPFVDESGQWRVDAERARFHRWRDRALFTPTEPRDWAAREESLERVERPNDPGFIVLPLDESALASWTDLVLTGQLSTIRLTDPQRFPALLRKGPSDRFEHDHPPDAATVDTLITQLDLYLGDRGFYWLVALATLPVIRWELVLLLGRDALGRLPRLADPLALNASLALNYRRLVRLPWLRRGVMPDWLRLRLLLELSDAQQAELRQVVRMLFGPLSPDAGERGLELEFERPPSADPGPSFLRPPGRGGDPIYLGYTSGLTPEQLALRAPRQWRSWASTLQRRDRAGRSWPGRLAARMRAAWARVVWTGGTPYAGLNYRGLAMLVLLIVPLAAALGAARRLAQADISENLSRPFFVRRGHDLAIAASSPPTAVAFSNDAGRIVSGHVDGTVHIWDAQTLEPIGAPLRWHTSPIDSVAFSADGNRIAAATRDGIVTLSNLQTGTTASKTLGGAIRLNIGFEPSGNLFAGGAFYDDSFANFGVVYEASPPRPTVWSWSPSNSNILAVGDNSGYLGVFYGRQPIATLQRFVFPRDIAISSDGSRVASRDTGDVARLYGVELNRSMSLLLELGDAPSPVTAFVFTPDSARLALGRANGSVELHDAQRGVAIGSPLKAHTAGITGMAFNKDGQRMVTASLDGTLRFWDALPGGASQAAPATRDETLPVARLERRAIDVAAALSASQVAWGLGGAMVALWIAQITWQQSRAARLARARQRPT